MGPGRRGRMRGAKEVRAGASRAGGGVRGRKVFLTEGVVRAMIWNKMKYMVLAAVLAIGLAGFGIIHWVSASDGQANGRKSLTEAADGKEAARADDNRMPTPARRREAVIRLPLGAYVKEVDVPPYGSGRLTWTYEEDRVLGLIEGSA